ncbi:MAG: sigma-70 family RNA polymerase sigma factor [Clostridia bacterium]|nr:sigma-70 family RNA polymerase sigma factor [Clostridia bacterium]
MQRKILSLDKFTESLFSMENYKKSKFDGEDLKHKKMISSLKNVMRGELTEKQKICIGMYYGEKMKMRDIAAELGISISCVSRHIKRAKNKLTKTMNYYF